MQFFVSKYTMLLKIYMYDDFRNFTFFGLGVTLVNEKWHLVDPYIHWLDLFSIYQYVKHYQNIPNGLIGMAIFAY